MEVAEGCDRTKVVDLLALAVDPWNLRYLRNLRDLIN